MRISIWSREYETFIYPEDDHDFQLRMKDDDLILWDNGTGKEANDYAILLASPFTAPVDGKSIIKPIFQGDIVSWTSEWDSYEPDGEGYVEKSIERKGTVTFTNGVFRVKDIPGTLADHVAEKNFRILGNIYEHGTSLLL